jgi:hypothetical protein
LPTNAQHQAIGTELCTLAGVTYVSLPNDAVLPADQYAEVVASIVNPCVPDAALLADIKAASPHVALINANVARQIAERYSTGDEIKLLRTAPSEEFDVYNDFVESCRAWGRAQKAAFGL